MEVKCLRCGYAWVSRTPDTPPDQCANPKCRTYYWDRLPWSPAQEYQRPLSGGTSESGLIKEVSGNPLAL